MNVNFNLSMEDARELATRSDARGTDFDSAIVERENAARVINDRTVAEKRDRNADEQKAFARFMADREELMDLRSLVASHREGEERASREIIDSIAGAGSWDRATRSGIKRWTREDDERVERFFGCDRSVSTVDMSLAPFRVVRDGLRSRVLEERAIGGYAGAGTLGSLIPTGVAAEIYQVLLDSAGAIWRMGPRIESTGPDGAPIRWPRMTVPGTATITNEGVAFTESDPTLDAITTSPYKYGHLTKVSWEVINDSPVNMAQFVAEHSGVAMAKTMGTHFATGTGSGQPQGYTTGAAGSLVAGGTITPPNLLQLIHKLPQRYRENAVIITNDPVAAFLRSYRSGSGGTLDGFMMPMSAPQWNPSTAAGGLEVFAGLPVVIDNNIPAHGSAVASLFVADMSKYYLVHDAGLSFERSDERYFDTDQVGFRARWRLDGKVIDGNACVKYLANAN